MSKVTVITDSTAYIPPDLVNEFNITVVPLEVIWGEETFRDGVDISPNEFYTRLKTATIMPSTSQVTIMSFQELFSHHLEQGRGIICILISSKLSGTVNSASQAKEAFPNAPIEISDSYMTSMALGFQALSVAKAASQGASFEECVDIARNARERTGAVFAVETLEFLHRGGRIGGASRLLGTALNIKPILHIEDGQVDAIEKVRTRQKSLSRIVEIVEERTEGKRPLRIAVVHANAEADAQAVLEQTKKLNAEEYILSHVSPVIGTHVGPGTVGITYMAGM